MIFVRPFYDNFGTTLTYLFYFIFSSFFSLPLLFLTNKKREKEDCHKICPEMIVQKSLLYNYLVIFTFSTILFGPLCTGYRWK